MISATVTGPFLGDEHLRQSRLGLELCRRFLEQFRGEFSAACELAAFLHWHLLALAIARSFGQGLLVLSGSEPGRAWVPARLVSQV
jgi:hypothetical protein